MLAVPPITSQRSSVPSPFPRQESEMNLAATAMKKLINTCKGTERKPDSRLRILVQSPSPCKNRALRRAKMPNSTGSRRNHEKLVDLITGLLEGKSGDSVTNQYQTDSQINLHYLDTISDPMVIFAPKMCSRIY